MKPHVHAEAIKAWADGAVIEHWQDGIWEVSNPPMWRDGEHYRVKDPYHHHLKEAAADPTKQIRLIHSDWRDSDYKWNWNFQPEDYEIRDKPKAKIKMWQWIYQEQSGAIYLTSSFTTEPSDFGDIKVIGPALWTEIEVEE